MKVPPSGLHTDTDGNEYVAGPDGEPRAVHTDDEGRRYVKRSRTSRLLAAVVGVVMVGYAVLAFTDGLSLPLHLQYMGAGGLVATFSLGSLLTGAVAGTVGLGVLRVSYTGREGVYVSESGAIIDDVPDSTEDQDWEFGNESR